MEFNGLPLHPLVVHAVVVLAPLAGLVGLSYAAMARWRWLLRWPLVALAVATAVTAQVAVAAGESLVEATPALAQPVADHQDWGELLRSCAVAFVVVAGLAAWALGGPSSLVSGAGARNTRGAVVWAAAGLLVLVSVGLLVLVFLAGDSGSRAVWGG